MRPLNSARDTMVAWPGWGRAGPVRVAKFGLKIRALRAYVDGCHWHNSPIIKPLIYSYMSGRNRMVYAAFIGCRIAEATALS